MMRKPRAVLRATAFVAALCLLAVAPANADARKGNGEIGFDVGYMEWDTESSSSSGGRADFRIGYHLCNVFQLEAEFGGASRPDTTQATAFLNGVFNFHSGNALMPYFLLGGGVARTEIDDVSDTGPAAQLMGGARAFGPKGKVGLRLEAGVIWEDTFESSSTHGMITVGFTFVLGRGRHGHHEAPEQPVYSSGG